MEINENLSKLIFEEFENSIKGTDIYNHEGSMWLIFTEERKWVVEFTKQKTLWYNYKHFNDILMLFGMEVSDGAKYIKKWYEDKFIFNAIKQNASTLLYVDDVIENGVKETDKSYSNYRLCVENTIQNGVKHMTSGEFISEDIIEDAIQNGIKETRGWGFTMGQISVEDTIQNGVINTIPTYNELENVVEDTVKNGVKKVDDSIKERLFFVEDAIQNGVKRVELDYEGHTRIGDTIQNGVNVISWAHPIANHSNQVDDIIQNGVKEVEYYDGDAEVLVNDAIENGVKKVDHQILESMEQKDHLVTTLEFTKKIRDTIENGVKEIS